MTLDNTPQPSGQPYQYRAQVTNIVDGDTFDVRIDLGFEVQNIERVRTRDIDTAEIHFVDTEGKEYEKGIRQTRAFESWVDETRRESDSEWPFLFFSFEYNRGAYGRVIGDIWSKSKEEWASRYLFREYEHVELYEA